MGLDHILTGEAWRERCCRVVGPLGSDQRPIDSELDPMRRHATGG
jgi:hypothetical protein